MRIAIGIFLILHGIAHAVGFAVPWKFIEPEETPYKTTILNGLWNVGDVGIRIVGVIWLVGALAFVATGIGALAALPFWIPLLLYSTIFSLVLSVFGWPEARIGVWINIILFALFLALNAEWLAGF